MKELTYKEENFLKTLDEKQIVKLKNLIRKISIEFTNDIKALNQSLLSDSFSNKLVNIYKISLIENTLREILELRNLNNMPNIVKKSMIKRSEKIEEMTINSFRKDIRTTLKSCRIVFYQKLKKIIFKFFLMDKNDEFVLKIDNLKLYHILLIRNNVKVLVYNQTLLKPDTILKDFGVKIIKSNKYNISKIQNNNAVLRSPKRFNFFNMHIQRNDLNAKSDIKQYLDLRIFFNKEDYHPNIKFISQYIKNNVDANSELYIMFPLYLETNSNLLKSKYHGYFEIYYERPNYYSKMIKEIAMLSSQYNIKICIPNKINYECYLKWRFIIKSTFKTLNMSPPLIGIVIDEDSMLADINEYLELDFAIIDFDEISYTHIGEDKKVNRKIFEQGMINQLRDIHTELLELKKEHIIISKRLNDQAVIEKLMMLGFTNFIYPSIYNVKINEVIDRYMSRRGKFVGITKGKLKKTDKSQVNTCNLETYCI